MKIVLSSAIPTFLLSQWIARVGEPEELSEQWIGDLHPHCPEPCRLLRVSWILGRGNQFELKSTKISRIIPHFNFFILFFVGTKQIQSSFGYKILQSESSTMEQESITQPSFSSFCLHSFLTCPSVLVHRSKYQAIFLYWGHVTRYVIDVLLLLFNRWHFRNPSKTLALTASVFLPR